VYGHLRGVPTSCAPTDPNPIVTAAWSTPSNRSIPDDNFGLGSSGPLAGFIGSKIVNKTGEGLLLDIILGIVGAVVGGWIFNQFGHVGVHRPEFLQLAGSRGRRGDRAGRVARHPPHLTASHLGRKEKVAVNDQPPFSLPGNEKT
jgi:hypothetical protein